MSTESTSSLVCDAHPHCVETSLLAFSPGKAYSTFSLLQTQGQLAAEVLLLKYRLENKKIPYCLAESRPKALGLIIINLNAACDV